MSQFIAIFTRFLFLLGLSSMMTVLMNPNLINVDDYFIILRVNSDTIKSKTNRVPPSDAANMSRVEKMICQLPDLDPWQEKALPYIDNTANKMFGCQVQYKIRSYMKDGRVVLHSEEVKNGTKCKFRCLYPKNDYKFAAGDWLPILNVPDCDVLELNCSRKNETEFTYNIVHTQIYRKDVSRISPSSYESRLNYKTTTPPDKLDLHRAVYNTSASIRRPDVHIIVFDSVSSTQFMRSMGATLNVLRHEMDGRVFGNLNKVGLNSMPNAYALLLGRQVYEMEESPVNNRYPPDINITETCNKRFLDKEQFIGYEFKKNGYKTMFSEDWDMGVFNWLNCKGFNQTPVDHYMRPFQLRLESMQDQGLNSTFRQRMYDDMCKEPHEYQMDYLKNFIDAYPDRPKFSINWLAYLAHDDTNALYHVDMYFKELFRTYKEKLSNSFLFIMGDHGNRYDKIRQTKLGEAEEKNPLLMVVLPRHLRGNQHLWSNLNKNAKQLTTHFDTYATLVDIAYNAPNYTSTSLFNGYKVPNKKLDIIGESYLHQYNSSKPRNCNNLRIPFDFCNCQFEQKDQSADHVFGDKIGNFLIDVVNNAIVSHNHSDLCEKLTLYPNNTVSVQEFEPGAQFNTFKVTIRTIPGGGYVWAYVQVIGDRSSGDVRFSMISEKPARLDAYEQNSKCSRDTYVKPYCFCKDILTSGPMLVLQDGHQ